MAELTWQQKALQEVGKKIQSGEARWNDTVPTPPSVQGTPSAQVSVPKPPGYSQAVRDQNFAAFQADKSANGMVYDDWLDKNVNVPKPPTVTVQAPKTVTSATPSYSVPTANVPAPPNTIDHDAIAREAKAKIDRQIAERTRIANQTKQGMQSTYDKLRTTIGEDRALQNTELQRRLNPFSGRSDYANATVERERARSDREMQQDLAARMGNVDAQLMDFLNLAPEQQQAMENELRRMERDYGLQVGQLTGYFNGGNTLARDQYQSNRDIAEGQLLGNYRGSPTLAAQQFQWGQQMDVADRTGQLNGSSTLAGKQANLNAALQVGDRMGKVLKPTVDWGDPLYEQNAPPTMQAQTWELQQETSRLHNEMAKLELSNYPEEQKLKIQQLRRQIEQIGRVPSRTPEEVEMAKIKLETAKAELSNLTNGSNKKPTDYKTSPGFAEDVAGLQSMGPDQAKATLTQQAQAFISEYGYDGYMALMKMFEDKY